MTFGVELFENAVLQPEHLLLLLRLGVVVAEEVQDTVDREHREFVVEGASCLFGLTLRESGTDHDVAEDRRTGFRGVGAAAWDEFVHREAHDVGRPGQIHPLDVHVGHRVLVDQQQRELGCRIDIHRPHGEPCRTDDQFRRGLDA